MIFYSSFDWIITCNKQKSITNAAFVQVFLFFVFRLRMGLTGAEIDNCFCLILLLVIDFCLLKVIILCVNKSITSNKVNRAIFICLLKVKK